MMTSSYKHGPVSLLQPEGYVNDRITYGSSKATPCPTGFWPASGDVSQGPELLQNVLIHRTFAVRSRPMTAVLARNPGNGPPRQELARDRFGEDAAVHIPADGEPQKVECRRTDIEQRGHLELPARAHGGAPKEQDAGRRFHPPTTVVVVIEPVVAELEPMVRDNEEHGVGSELFHQPPEPSVLVDVHRL